MVTATPSRIPHAVQSGPTPTSLWLTLCAISLANTVVPLLLLPVAGRHLIWRNGLLVPDMSLWLGLLAICVALLVTWFISRWVASAMDMHIPGQLNPGSENEIPARATRIPSVVATVVIVGAETGAVFYAAAHTAGDHGLIALCLMVAGVVLAVQFCGRSIALILIARRWPDWKGDTGMMALRCLPTSVAMFVAGRFVAPRGEVSDAGIVMGVGMIPLIALTILWTFRIVVGQSGPGGGIHDLASSVSGGVLSRTNAAPTLQDQERGTRLAKVGIYSAIAFGALLCLAIALT